MNTKTKTKTETDQILRIFFIYQYIDIFSKTTTRKITTTKSYRLYFQKRIFETHFPKAYCAHAYLQQPYFTKVFSQKSIKEKKKLCLSHSKSAVLRSCKVYFSNIVNFSLRRRQLGPNNHNVTVVF